MFDAAKYGPWAVVTGGSEGIGAAMAVELGGAGVDVVLIARRPEPLAEVADEVRSQTGAEVRTLSLDLLIELNVKVPTILVHHFARPMVERGRGGIALIGALAQVAGSPTVVPYSASKAYSQRFCEGLWWELKDQGVDVLHVIATATNTPLKARQGVVLDHGVAGEVVARYMLENLGNGPVCIMPQVIDAVRERTTTDRRHATEITADRIMATTSRAQRLT